MIFLNKKTKNKYLDFVDTPSIYYDVGIDGVKAHTVYNFNYFDTYNYTKSRDKRNYYQFNLQNQNDLFGWNLIITVINGVQTLVLLNNKIYSSGFDYSGNRYYYYLTNSGVMYTNYWEYYTIGLPDNYKNRNFWFKVERISAPSSFYITAWSYTLVNYSLDYIPQGDTNISYYFVAQHKEVTVNAQKENKINNVYGVNNAIRHIYGIYGYYDNFGYEYGYINDMENLKTNYD